MTFLFWLVSVVLASCLGYWVALHPADTRSFMEKVRASIGRMLDKLRRK